MTTKTATRKDAKQVSAVFDAGSEFIAAIQELEKRGFTEDDMNVLMSEQTRSAHFQGRNAKFTPQENSKAPEGATIGGLTGGLLGAIIGGLTMIGTLTIPGTQFLAVGPIVGALTGGAAGAATGGLIGALTGAGIPEHEARFFEEAVNRNGKILLVVSVHKDRTGEVEKLLKGCNAEKVRTSG